MLRDGRWCSTACGRSQVVPRKVSAASTASAASSSTAAGRSSATKPGPSTSGTGSSTPLPAAPAVMHDAISTLRLVRAATAALALVADVGYEAAVRYLSQEYYHVAATVRHCLCGCWAKLC